MKPTVVINSFKPSLYSMVVKGLTIVGFLLWKLSEIEVILKSGGTCNVKYEHHFNSIFITLVIAILSGLVFLIPSAPIKYIKIHLYLIVLPIIISVIGLLNVSDREQIGPFTMDHLAWLMGSFILILGFIIQKFSVRYLIGDRNYRKYFPLFTLITSFASVHG